MTKLKIYIQSKSGDFNATVKMAVESLEEAIFSLRESGGYPAEYRGEMVFVSFEEIQYIKKAKDSDIV